MKHQIQYSILTDEQLSEWEKLVNNNIESLILYSDQLLWWNKKVNLVSRDVSHETVLEHIKHSLLLSVVNSFKSANNIIDTGSGGGLPGIPLSICFPQKQFVLNDIVAKKVMAMKQMGFKLKLSNLKTASGSIAHQPITNELIITKHAFKVDELVGLLDDLPWKKLLFLKGANEAEPEIKRLDIPVSSNIIELDTSFDDPFYKGKGIVEVSRVDE
ncbi:MAG: 16S rRNA (guanine(527)-N(7))-methyltransferase RsmG [Balneolaceae bacterium]